MSQIDIDKRVGQYIKLRAKIKEIEAKHKELMAPYKDMLEQLNTLLLGHLTQINTDSASTQSGTVYRTAKSSASIKDADAFLQFIQSTGQFDMLDLKANVTATAEYIEANKAPPPGVNYTSVYVVGVRAK